MSYAGLPDLLARAGMLRDAWDEDTEPSTTDLQAFLQTTSDELDARIGAYGFALPISDPIAQAALVGVNADLALLLALGSTWPGNGGPQQARDLVALVQKRVDGYQTALDDGNLPALLYLANLGSGGTDTEQSGSGASSFWTHDGVDYTYEWWSERLGGWTRNIWSDPWGVPRAVGPEFKKGMAL